MSYDIKITKKNDEFSQFLISKGAKKLKENTIVHTNEATSSYFLLTGNFLSFNYGRSHAHIYLTFDILKEALEKVEGFEFEDLQIGQIFNSANKSNLTDELVEKQARQYAIQNKTLSNIMTAKGAVRIDQPKISVPFDTADRIIKDIYYNSEYKNILTKTYSDTFFAKPFFMVNLKEKKYKILYTWIDFIPQVFPSDLHIDLILLQYKETKKQFLNFDSLAKILPQPQLINVPKLGKRLYYNIEENEAETFWPETQKLPIESMGDGFQGDLKLSTLVSI